MKLYSVFSYNNQIGRCLSEGITATIVDGPLLIQRRKETRIFNRSFIKTMCVCGTNPNEVSLHQLRFLNRNCSCCSAFKDSASLHDF